MMRNILNIVFVYLLFDYGQCCEDNWNIKSDTIINKSSVIFKNTTITGTSELLSWTWFANNKAVWSSTFFRKFNNEIRGGGFVYMNTNLKKRHLLSLKWMKNKGQDISWTVSGNPEISQIPWKISIPKVLTWGFTPTDENEWDFNIDNFVISSDMVKRPSIEEYPDMDTLETSPLRVKREEREELSPESESEDMIRGNKSANARNWIHKAVNFFFGEGDQARGQKPGIFTTVGRWMRNMACKISQQCCSTGEPTPDFVTPPPMRPDSMHPSTPPPSFEPTSSSAPPPPEPSPSISPSPEPSPTPPPSEPSPSIPETPEEAPIETPENMETLDAEIVPEETRQNDI